MVNLKLHDDVCDLCSVISGDMQYLDKVLNNKRWLPVFTLTHFGVNVPFKIVSFFCPHHNTVHLCFSVFFAVLLFPS